MCVDSGANRSKEKSLTELIEYSKPFQLVLDRVFKLGKGQFHAHDAKRFI